MKDLAYQTPTLVRICIFPSKNAHTNNTESRIPGILDTLQHRVKASRYWKH